MPGHDWGEVIYNFIVIYLILSFLLTCYSIVRMYIVMYHCNGTKYGKKRVVELTGQGRFRQMPVYSMEQIRENKDLGTVRLSFFPNDTKERTKYVLILPGGGYAHCMTRQEGYPMAAKLNEMGFSAFVLEYRTGFHCSPYAPMEDVANAIKLIEKKKDEFGVDTEDYALCGFSAGGNLAGVYAGLEHGYATYGTKKPAAIILGYPWTNINHWLDHPYWNVWKGLMGIWLSERGYIYMFGRHSNAQKRDSLCVQRLVTEEYPPTYMFSGGWDVLVPASHHAEVLEQALDSYEIPHKYRRYFSLPHGIGLALGTNAEGWITEAVEFWKKTWK